MQWDDDSKHKSKSTTEWIQYNNLHLLEWPSQSPDLILVEVLWHELNGPKFFLTIVQVWSETVENILFEVIANKGAQPITKPEGSHTFSTIHLNVYVLCSIKRWKDVFFSVW